MTEKLPVRQILFSIFAFSVTATLAFLMAKNLTSANATRDGFNAGNIISDAAMRDYNSLSEGDIQTFLKSKNSCNDTNLGKYDGYQHIENGHFVCLADESFDGESAAHIIYRAAQDYHINPKALIVLLEKEQSLVTDTWPSSIQLRAATGYGCPDTAACDSEYYGFRNQVRKAAELYDDVLSGGWTNYPVGWNYIQYNPNPDCGGSWVNIENLATSALYRYTPYQPGGDESVGCGAYGNINFYDFYTSWFGSTQQVFKPSQLDNIYIEEGLYSLLDVDGKALDVYGDETGDGANIDIWGYHGGSSQIFKITRTSDGFYRLSSLLSGKSLDINGGSVLAGANVQLWSSHDGCNQKWAISEKDGYYVLRSACSGLALDVTGGWTGSDGTNVETWTFHGGSAQQWRLVSHEDPVLADGDYNIITNRGLALDVYGGGTNDGANIEIWNTARHDPQIFHLAHSEDGFYHITNPRADKSLDVYAGSRDVGANIQLWSSHDGCNQKWVVALSSDGTYSFRNACSGNALDVHGGWTGNAGTNVATWNYHGGYSQQFFLLRSGEDPVNLSGSYQISSALNSTQGLDVYAAGTAAGTNVTSYTLRNQVNQRFTITHTSDGFYYRITNPNAKKALDVYAGSSIPGANVQLWDIHDGCNQKWSIFPSPIHPGYYYLLSACSGLALDVYGGVAYSGANIETWTFHGGKSELWKFTND